jgi:hypothetical protein
MIVTVFASTSVLLGCQGDDNSLPLPPSDASADAKGTDAASDATVDSEPTGGDAAQKDVSVADASSPVEGGADDSSADAQPDAPRVQEAGTDSQADGAGADGGD